MASPRLVSTESRRQPRQRTLLGGEIIFNGGTSAFECLVRDMSDRGCRLAMSSTVGVPSRFTLKIKRDGRQFSATVRWRDDKFIGIEFVDENDVSSSAADRPQPASRGTNLRIVAR